VGFYGLILSVFAISIQIFFILNYWKNNPTQKQTTRFTTGCLLFLLALIFFGIGLYQINSYFGGIGLIMWLIIGAVPFVISSLILLTIPTAPKNRK
jgi:hypothetical protein